MRPAFIALLTLCLCLPTAGADKKKGGFQSIKALAEKGDARAQFGVGAAYSTFVPSTQVVKKDDTKALKWFRKAADQDFALAQFFLGEMYRRGQGVPKDFKEAVKWYRKASEQGHVSGQHTLGLMYGYGQGVLQNYVMAYAWANIAAANGDKTAPKFKSAFLDEKMTFEQIVKAEDLVKEMVEKNPKLLKSLPDEVRAIKKLADMGDSKSCFQIGMAYGDPKSVHKDYQESFKWLLKAAEKGHLEAQHYVGVYYSFGRGVGRDLKESIKWLEKSAEEGYAQAQTSLGMSYFKGGLGVERDRVAGLAWLFLAVSNGDEAFEKNITLMKREMSPDQISQAQKLSKEMIKKNPKLSHDALKLEGEKGSAELQYSLGQKYHGVYGGPKDFKEAVKWYRKASEQGHADAQMKLGYCYANGQGVKKNIIEAVRLYRKAADQGNINGQIILATLYLSGRVAEVGQDFNEAAKWFREAANQGSAQGQWGIGNMYFIGVGVKKDIDEAKKWLLKSAHQGEVKAQGLLGDIFAMEDTPTGLIFAFTWSRIAAANGDARSRKNAFALSKTWPPEMKLKADEMFKSFVKLRPKLLNK